MTPPPTSTAPQALPAASAFAEALAQVVGTLLMYIFQRLHALAPIGTEVYRRITRPHQRIQRLMAALAKGTWKAPKPRKPRAKKTPEPTTDTPRPKRVYVPEAHGWLGSKYGYFIRGYFAQVEHILTRPETQSLLADLPPEALKTLGRNVRPLCRLFAIQPPECLRLPKRERKPRPEKPRKPRPKKLRLRTPKMLPYATTSSTPWRVVRSKVSKFWA